MLRLPIVISLIFFAFVNLYGQEIPEVKFNHLSFVLESRDIKALRESSFVTDTLVAYETRTTKVKSQATSTATFLYGHSNYLEFFETSGDDPNLGFLTIVFSVDKISEFNKLQSLLDNTFQTEITSRQRLLDSVKIPWYDALSVVDTTIIDSTFLSHCHFWFWIMMYKTEYFECKNMTINNDELTRENYLEEYNSERKNKIVKRFSGIVMKLNPDEKEYLTKFFEKIAYKRINGNEYLSPDNFKFLIKDRRSGDQNSIESIKFETSKSLLNKKTVEISDNIVIIIEGDEGQLSFKETAANSNENVK
ncbi:MAG: hypothetical protein A2W30_08610 [Ignavibacteria bacterium RBG_16_36_9]|nr:MAG: hypothetical protein A2W30_08610 [Ignavibacteria bacterium RBG_16_36_9]